jgi:hypothetical protein
VSCRHLFNFSWAEKKGGKKLMKAKYTLIIAMLMLLFSFSLALAEDSDDSGALDATMRLMDDAEANLPEAVTKPIQLPEHLRESTVAADKSTTGHTEANAARDNQHRKDGLNKANDARDRASSLAEAAKDNRESHGRSEDRPEPPDPPNPGGPPG